MAHSPSPRRVLIAPDAFKGTFTAAAVAASAADGAVDAGWVADPCPVADGGEGTTAALLAAYGGEWRAATVTGPLGHPVVAHFALLSDGQTAVVEVAEASGLNLVEPSVRTAVAADTSGTGELMVAAAAAGARRIFVAAGGSATTDGGRGALDALKGAGGLKSVEVVVLCDVMVRFENAAREFGAQKGADQAAVRRLTDRLQHLAETYPRDPRGKPMTGCAGGLSGGLWAVIGAKLVGGASAVLEAVRFDCRLVTADTVITGEGRLDNQSMKGKIVGEIARRCQNAGKPVYAIAGAIQLTPQERKRLGFSRILEAPTLVDVRDATLRILSAAPTVTPPGPAHGI